MESGERRADKEAGGSLREDEGEERMMRSQHSALFLVCARVFRLSLSPLASSIIRRARVWLSRNMGLEQVRRGSHYFEFWHFPRKKGNDRYIYRHYRHRSPRVGVSAFRRVMSSSSSFVVCVLSRFFLNFFTPQRKYKH